MWLFFLGYCLWFCLRCSRPALRRPLGRGSLWCADNRLWRAGRWCIARGVWSAAGPTVVKGLSGRVLIHSKAGQACGENDVARRVRPAVSAMPSPRRLMESAVVLLAMNEPAAIRLMPRVANPMPKASFVSNFSLPE